LKPSTVYNQEPPPRTLRCPQKILGWVRILGFAPTPLLKSGRQILKSLCHRKQDHTVNKLTIWYDSIPLASLSNLRAKMRKFAIAPVRLKLDFWPSSQWYFSAFDGPTEKIQVRCHSTPGVVYKYVKITHTEKTRRFLWNAKLCINA